MPHLISASLVFYAENHTMNFSEIASKFESSDAGTDTYKEFYKDLYKLMAVDKGNAALYFVIAIIAQAYVRRYEEEAVPKFFAEKVQARFSRFNKRINEGLASDGAVRLAIISEIALEYELEISEF